MSPTLENIKAEMSKLEEILDMIETSNKKEEKIEELDKTIKQNSLRGIEAEIRKLKAVNQDQGKEKDEQELERTKEIPRMEPLDNELDDQSEDLEEIRVIMEPKEDPEVNPNILKKDITKLTEMSPTLENIKAEMSKLEEILDMIETSNKKEEKIEELDKTIKQ